MNSSRKPHVRERSRWFLRKFFVWRVGCFEWSIQLLAIFSSLVHPVSSILHILIKLNGLNNLATISLMLDHSKIRKMHFWMIQSAKKEFFGHFLEFGQLDRLDIADCDSTKRFPTFGNVTKSWRIIQKSQKSIFQWSKEPINVFLVNRFHFFKGFNVVNSLDADVEPAGPLRYSSQRQLRSGLVLLGSWLAR